MTLTLLASTVTNRTADRTIIDSSMVVLLGKQDNDTVHSLVEHLTSMSGNAIYTAESVELDYIGMEHVRLQQERVGSSGEREREREREVTP